jgi:hypothetical protein
MVGKYEFTGKKGSVYIEKFVRQLIIVLVPKLA